ncbi:hypothetical protein ACFWAP_00880 [Streptomyces goshikiensis]|uniref:hypothetical protein n=1 Tax=Streptomyces goshikiensis TaxID=1942 RepID=UPI00365AEFE8
MQFQGFEARGWLKITTPGAERLWMVGERDTGDYVVASWGSNTDPQPGQEWDQGRYMKEKAVAVSRFLGFYGAAVADYGAEHVAIWGYPSFTGEIDCGSGSTQELTRLRNSQSDAFAGVRTLDEAIAHLEGLRSARLADAARTTAQLLFFGAHISPEDLALVDAFPSVRRQLLSVPANV